MSITIAENQDGLCSFDGVLATSVQGYNGNGYIDFTNSSSSKVTYRINAVDAGIYGLRVRYNHSSSQNLTGDVYVDNVKAGSFSGKPGSTSWQLEDVAITLKQGIHGIELRATTAAGLPN
ncbi:MAG: hypothetical protein EOP48_32480, partial [Sphingobacteriales bacterium]